MKLENAKYISLYLIAIIAANLLTARYGPRMAYINAFLFIGLDLTARDKLHEAWGGRGLIWKMGLLIASGSFLSWIFNQDAGRVAAASFIAFACAGLADALIYQLLKGRDYLVKVNGSNVVSSAVDSLVFPTIAFGGFSVWVTLMQFTAKILGGFIWSLLLRQPNKNASYKA